MRKFGRADHPRIVRALSVGRDPTRGASFVVLDHEGLALADAAMGIDRALDQILRWLEDVAAGMDAVHRAGLTLDVLSPWTVTVDASGRASIAHPGLLQALGTTRLGLTSTTRFGAGVPGPPSPARDRLLFDRLLLYLLRVATTSIDQRVAITEAAGEQHAIWADRQRAWRPLLTVLARPSISASARIRTIRRAVRELGGATRHRRLGPRGPILAATVAAVALAGLGWALLDRSEGPAPKPAPAATEDNPSATVRTPDWTTPTDLTPREALIRAAAEGNVRLARWALDNGADPEASGEDGISLLLRCARHGRIGVLAALLSAGAFIDRTGDASGLFDEHKLTDATALHVGVLAAQHDVVDALLQRDASTAMRAHHTHPSLFQREYGEAQGGWVVPDAHIMHLAAVSYDGVRFKRLLDRLPGSADVNSGQNDRPLHQAAAFRNVGAARMLLDAGADTSLRNDAGMTPILVAAHRGSTAIVRMIHGRAPRALEAVAGNGAGPLHLAAASGDVRLMTYLLSNGLPRDALDKSRHPAIAYAIQQDRLDAAKWLRQRGADLQVRVHDGWTLLHEAAHHGAPRSLQWLLAEWAESATIRADDGSTALHLAATDDCLACIRPLAEVIDPDTSDKLGDTPLHNAVQNNAANVASRLLEVGASPDSKNGQGLTPRELGLKSTNAGIRVLFKR